MNYSNSIPIGSLLASASESDSKSNKLKMSNKQCGNVDLVYVKT